MITRGRFTYEIFIKSFQVACFLELFPGEITTQECTPLTYGLIALLAVWVELFPLLKDTCREALGFSRAVDVSFRKLGLKADSDLKQLVG